MRTLFTFFTTLLVLTASLVYAGQDDQNKKVSRYYVGIGAQLNKESNGSFTVGRMLPGSPAELSNLKQGDVIVSFDQVTTQAYWLGNREEGRGQVLNLSDWLTEREGQQVSLRVKRGDSELDINIYPVQIDRVAWVYFDLPLGGGFGSQDGMVKYTSQVSEDKQTGKFTYRYDFSNDTPEPVILSSTIFSLFFRKDETDITQYYLKIRSGGNQSFVLESDSFPVGSVPSATRQFDEATPKMLKYFQENSLLDSERSYRDSSGKLWLNTVGTSLHLVVPVKWQFTLVEEDERFWARPR